MAVLGPYSHLLIPFYKLSYFLTKLYRWGMPHKFDLKIIHDKWNNVSFTLLKGWNLAKCDLTRWDGNVGTGPVPGKAAWRESIQLVAVLPFSISTFTYSGWDPAPYTESFNKLNYKLLCEATNKLHGFIVGVKNFHHFDTRYRYLHELAFEKIFTELLKAKIIWFLGQRVGSENIFIGSWSGSDYTGNSE